MCPFRKDSTKQWLGKERAEGISEILTTGKGTFSCHETTGVKSDIKIPHQNQQHCFGALQMLRNAGKLETGFIFQMAERLLDADFSKIKKNTDIVFEDESQFILHHSVE